MAGSFGGNLCIVWGALLAHVPHSVERGRHFMAMSLQVDVLLPQQGLPKLTRGVLHVFRQPSPFARLSALRVLIILNAA
jgi:hypothetical protein